MMKCTVITPWPVWLGSAPCLFGLLSKPPYSCLLLYISVLYIDIDIDLDNWAYWSISTNSRT